MNKSYKQYRELYLMTKCINLGITLPCLLIDEIFTGYIVIGVLLSSLIFKIVINEDDKFHTMRIKSIFTKDTDIQSIKFCILEIIN